MTILVRIVNTDGEVREVTMQSGEATVVAAGDRIALVDVEPDAVEVVRQEDDAVVRLGGGDHFTLVNFARYVGDDAPTLTFANDVTGGFVACVNSETEAPGHLGSASTPTRAIPTDPAAPRDGGAKQKILLDDIFGGPDLDELSAEIAQSSRSGGGGSFRSDGSVHLHSLGRGQGNGDGRIHAGDVGEGIAPSEVPPNASEAGVVIPPTFAVARVSTDAPTDDPQANALAVAVTDGGGLGDSATVTVSLTDVNETPVIADQGFVVAENAADATVVGTVAASDPDAGDSLGYAITGGNAGGAFAIDPASGQISVANGAALDFEGQPSYALAVAVTDAGGLGDSATVTVSLTDVNEAPVAVADIATTDENTAVTISVLGNDSDVDGDTLSVASVTQGANGAVAINPDNTLTYTPGAGFTGGDSFTYTVSDGNGGTDTATVGVTVYNVLGGGPGNDTVQGVNGPDKILGYGGDDLLKGKGGDDALYGGTGNDALQGQQGDDTLFGEDGNDNLSGGAGDDTLDGGAGDDSLAGGAGDDILVWDVVDVVIDGGSGTDRLRVDSGDADLTSFTGTISRIEEIDLASNAVANTVTLSAQDVLDISDTNTLTVLGDGGDSVSAGSGWTDAGFDGSGNHIFTQDVGGILATLVIAPDVTTNADIIV